MLAEAFNLLTSMYVHNIMLTDKSYQHETYIKHSVMAQENENEEESSEEEKYNFVDPAEKTAIIVKENRNRCVDEVWNVEEGRR